MTNKNRDTIFDVLIIGGGPSGLNAAFWAWRRNKTVAIIDMYDKVGGQVTRQWPDKIAFDIPGFPAIRGIDFVEGLEEQTLDSPLALSMKKAAPLPQLFAPEKAAGLKELQFEGKRLFKVTTEQLKVANDEVVDVVGKSELRARAILITAGTGTSTPRTFGDPNVDGYLHKGLEYVAGKQEAYRGKRVLIVGGGDSAVDWTHQLRSIAKLVLLIHRRDGFRASEQAILDHLREEGLIKVPFVVHAVEGKERVEAVTIRNTSTEELERLEIDAVIACLGQPANLSIFESWGLKMDGDHIAVETRFVENLPIPAYTNRVGIYATGEASNVKTNLIAFDIAFAGLAMLAAIHDLYPNERLCPQFSSSLSPKKKE